MSKIVVIGAGWSGCAAAVRAVKQGHEVTLLEKTDLLLGLGNVGGIMRNNGRFTAAEENIALGASELFAITESSAPTRILTFRDMIMRAFMMWQWLSLLYAGSLKSSGLISG